MDNPAQSARLKEAMMYEKGAGGQTLCHLCPHHCSINPGNPGKCGVRINRRGKLYTLTYGNNIVQHVNPIEKKPLFHFYPGASTYSIAPQGCNFKCGYCINWQISQFSSHQVGQAGGITSPKDIIKSALTADCNSISFTFVEPTIFFEYIYDVAPKAKKAGLHNLFKTNGFISETALKLISPYLDGANIDLKTFSDKAYQKLGGKLKPVLDTLKLAKSLGIWIEVSTVIIPGFNDDPAEIREIASFICSELGADTPWHITRFFPAYKMKDTIPTPLNSLYAAYETGYKTGLRYVYLGNLLEKGKQDTYCSKCSFSLIRRHGSSLIENKLIQGCCPKCGNVVAGIGL